MIHVSVMFFGDSQKLYTYKSKRDLNVDDFAIVETPTGRTVVKVMRIQNSIPSYECKEIIKKVRL